jgi:hypothetical protein
MMLKKVLWIVVGVGVAASVCAYSFTLNPLRKSHHDLRTWILEEAPPGSSVDQVKAFIKSHRWKVISEWHGNPSNISGEEAGFNDYPGVKGEYFIQADLGSYQGISFRVRVGAHWGLIPQEDCSI